MAVSRSNTTAREMFQDCLAVRIRLIGRNLTAVYDRAVEPEGLTIAQVNLMTALANVGPCSPTRLGSVLQLERSTVSRNLERLLKGGWVAPSSSDGKGVREVNLTASGEEKLESVLPLWRAAQKEAADLLGSSGVDAIQSIARELWHPEGP